MNKLFSLVAVIALFAAINAEARCGRQRCAPKAACTTSACPVACETPCEMQRLPDMVECAEKPVCKTIICGQPRKVCQEQKIVRCHWVCPPNCATFANEEEANQHDFTQGAARNSGY